MSIFILAEYQIMSVIQGLLKTTLSFLIDFVVSQVTDKTFYHNLLGFFSSHAV